MLAVLAVAWSAAGGVAAREVTVRGSPMKDFVRIALEFDQPTRVDVRATGGVLVIGFEGPARIKGERLEREISAQVSAVRRDPDGTGLRLALNRPVRTSVLQAGERVFVDLLPETWRGLPPGLPPEVVAELAERARRAEARLRRDGDVRPAVRPVTLRTAELPSLTRLVFETPPGIEPRVEPAGDGVRAVFDGRLRLDRSSARPGLGAGLADLVPTAADERLTVVIQPEPGFDLHHFREGDTLVVDVARPAPAQRLPEPLSRPAPKEQAAARSEPPPGGPDPAPPPPAAPPAAPVASGAPPPIPVSSGPTAPAGRPVVPQVERRQGGPSLLFPFGRPTPAAAWERGGRLHLVFETPDAIDRAALAAATADWLPVDEIVAEPGLSTLRFAAREADAFRLVPEGEAWRLVPAGPALPPDPLAVTRGSDAAGAGQVAIGLVSGASPRWMADPDGGGRLAVVPAIGRPQGISAARSFVEFDILPTLHGVVVAARSDDLSVSLGHAGVLVGRRAGLSLSPSGAGLEAGAAARTLVLARDHWVEDGSGSVLDRYRALVSAAAEAPRSGRAEARFRLARFMVANGLALEATSVLALARAEDNVFAKRKEALLLSGIAAFRAGRDRDAAASLSAETLSGDPEAQLWRAAIAARGRHWGEALTGFRRGAEVLRAYPDDLAGSLRLMALSAALEAGELSRAEAELAAIDRLSSGSVPRDEHDLARARTDEAAGRTEPALKGYERLAEEGSRPVAAAAGLRGALLAQKLGRLPDPEAIRRLEALAVTWRGDEVEVEAAVALAKLYASAGRWRDAFTIARQTTQHSRDHELTRGLADDAARMFEALLLGEDGRRLSAVDTLAIYHDFKEFAPIGRRGDEIVRRLADRLVELDLLAQAADLLQHQVAHRLSGTARATVAARLAAIRLMNGEPAQALSALHATRLAEMPAEARRMRLMLEARAQADLTRTDLALEILEDEPAPDAARLRAAILFGAGRWREAGEAGEALLGLRWQDGAALEERERADILRSAVAYGLAGEAIGLSRLRGKFGRPMADSPDAKRFAFLLQPGAVQTREFRELAQEVARLDPLRELLAGTNAGPARPDRAEAPARRPQDG